MAAHAQKDKEHGAASRLASMGQHCSLAAEGSCLGCTRAGCSGDSCLRFCLLPGTCSISKSLCRIWSTTAKGCVCVNQHTAGPECALAHAALHAAGCVLSSRYVKFWVTLHAHLAAGQGRAASRCQCRFGCLAGLAALVQLLVARIILVTAVFPAPCVCTLRCKASRVVKCWPACSADNRKRHSWMSKVKLLVQRHAVMAHAAAKPHLPWPATPFSGLRATLRLLGRSSPRSAGKGLTLLLACAALLGPRPSCERHSWAQAWIYQAHAAGQPACCWAGAVLCWQHARCGQ